MPQYLVLINLEVVNVTPFSYHVTIILAILIVSSLPMYQGCK